MLCACGSAATPKPLAPPPTMPAPLQQVVPAPDLTPVAAPPGLVGVGRLARPGDLAKTLAGWVSLPFDPGMLDALQPGMAKAVAIDAPVEFALVLPESETPQNAKPELVVTVGLTSLDKARTLLEEYLGQKLVERGPSLYVTPDDSKLHCAIAASIGKATSRLVCSDKPRSLEQLLPYATRGLPLENLGASDFHAELRIEPLRTKFAAALRMAKTMAVPALLKELSLSDARFDRPLGDMAHAVGDELLDLFEDADQIAIDANAGSNPEQMAFKLTLAYRGRASFIAQATADAKARMLPPNAQFFDLPADAAAAAYYAPADPKRLDKPRALVEGLVEGLLAHFEVAVPLRRDVRSAIEPFFNISSPVVAAFGAVPSVTDKGEPSAAERLALALGWRIYGIEAAAAPYKDAMRTLVRLSSDKAFQRGINDLWDETAPAGATAVKGNKPAPPAKVHSADWVKLRSKTLVGMPAGSEVMLIEFNQSATKELLSRAKRKVNKSKKLDALGLESLACLLAVVPDRGRTWFVFAMDDKTLRERANVVLANSQAPRLSTRSELSSLRGEAAVQAGFSTLLMVKGWLQLALLGQGKSTKEVETLISTLPHHAMTPMRFRSIVVGDDKRQAVELSTTIPRAVFDDAAASVPSLMTLLPD
jgi:hypothetical protein